jgi:leucyl aminopeptidase (aminopeptidase T)
MTTHTIADGAARVVEVCATVAPGETVLLVTDDPSRPVADAVADAARAVTDEVLMTVMPPVRHNGNEPPAAVAAAMQHADVIFHITHRSITHTQAAAAAKTPPTRWISLTKFTPEDLASPAIFADFARIRPHCDALAAAFTDATTARVTAPTGTDLTIDLGGCAGNSHPGIADSPGSHTALVHIEANVSPVGRSPTSTSAGWSVPSASRSPMGGSPTSLVAKRRTGSRPCGRSTTTPPSTRSPSWRWG